MFPKASGEQQLMPDHRWEMAAGGAEQQMPLKIMEKRGQMLFLPCILAERRSSPELPICASLSFP